MNILIIVAAVVIGASVIPLQRTSDVRLTKFLNLLLFALVTQTLVPEFNPESIELLYALIGILGVNFILGQFSTFQSAYIRLLFPVITLAGYLLLFDGITIEFKGDSYVSVNKFLILGVAIATVGYEFGLLKEKIASKLSLGIEDEDLMKSMLIFFIGIAVFLGMFASSVFGLMVITTGFISASFYRNDSSQGIGTSLLALVLIPFIAGLSDVQAVNVVNGDVLEGVFFGAFGMYLLHRLWKNGSSSLLLILAGYTIVLGVSIGLLWMGTLFELMGGTDAYAGIFLGIAVVNAIIGEGRTAIGIMSWLLAFGLLINPLMMNEEQNEMEERMILSMEDNENGAEAQVILPIDDLEGSYGIISDSSRVAFSLGEGGVTKGAFKKVSGNVRISDDHKLSTLNVILSLEDFTTYNATRDNSLLGDDYFKAEKFQTMTYKATGFEKGPENTYVIKGEFTMLGVTKALEVSLQRVQHGKNIVLVGFGKIDRTEFGMTPSASEGNVVDFNYQVFLN